jgi:Cohesin domain
VGVPTNLFDLGSEAAIVALHKASNLGDKRGADVLGRVPSGAEKEKRVSLWMQILRSGLLWTTALAMALATPSLGFAATVLIPALQAAPGDEVEIPVILDGVDNLAGLKVVLVYDSKVLQFLQERKEPIAQSLMHVVNPNTPGKLIIVMAGAKGIQIKNGPIIYLKFKVSETAPLATKSPLKIEEIQVMTDQLKNIKAATQAGELTVIDKAPPPSNKPANTRPKNQS